MDDFCDRVERARLAAKRQVGTLRTEIKFHVSHERGSRCEVDPAYRHLQKEIDKARSILRELSTSLEASGSDPDGCSEVQDLSNLLGEAVRQRSIIHDLLFGFQKRGSLAAFKDSVVALIERGEAPYWISTVTEKDLLNHGQEVNRLFQILVEDPSAVLVDSTTLARAAERSDLFTPKQREILEERSHEVERRALTETERLARKLQDEEDQMQPQTPAGGRFSASDGPAPVSIEAGWKCGNCTFVNDNRDADACSACHSQRAPSFIEVIKRKPDVKAQKKCLEVTKSVQTKAVLVKKPPGRGSSTNTVWIRNADVPELIGARGINMRALIAQTKATSIYAFQDRLDENVMCPVEVTGSRGAFGEVVRILKDKFEKNRDQPSKQLVSKRSFIKKLVFIPNADVPELIGPRGMAIQKMIAQLRVKSITALQENVGADGMCPIEIKGIAPEAVANAAETIISMFSGTPDNLWDKDLNNHSEARLPSQHFISNHESRQLSRSNIGGNGTQTTKIADSSVPADLPLSNAAPLLQSSASVICEPAKPLPAGSSCAKITLMTASLKESLGPLSNNHLRSINPLKDLLQENKSSLTCTSEEFYQWLVSVQISSLEELAEALDDDDFVNFEMKENGLKYFKRFSLKKAIKVKQGQKTLPVPTTGSNIVSVSHEPPAELVCPISHVIMVSDPVLCRDGYTYERKAIEEWLERKAISPMTQDELIDTALVSNAQIRTLARDWYQENQEHYQI